MPLKKKKLLIFGHYGVPNWGDEAILAGIKTAIDSNKWDITVISPFAKNIKKEHGLRSTLPPPYGIRSLIKSIWSKEVWKSIKTIKSADFILFGGGGLFQQYPRKALKIWTSYLKLCQKLGKRNLIAGNSIGPFRSDRALSKTAKLFQKVSFISVRDKNSRDILQKMKILEYKISLATDFSFFLPSQKKKYSARRGVIITLRRDDISKKEKKILKNLCEKLIKKYTKVEFLPMQTHQTTDSKLAKELGVPLVKIKTLSGVRNKITSARLVLTNRLHGAILSMLSETPFLAIASRPKISDFLKSADLSVFVSKKITEKELSKSIKKILNSPAKTQKLIRESVKGEKKKTAYLLPDFF